MASTPAARQTRAPRLQSEGVKGFIVLDKTYTPDSKVRYIQFGDECETFEAARKLALFPNLRDPIIVNLEDAEQAR